MEESRLKEQEEFSMRLKQALHKVGYVDLSPTQLAREFNLRYEGHPISVHAARKWLNGETIPTQQKLRVFAQWLGVAAEWLRYDGIERAAQLDYVQLPSHLTAADLQLFADLQLLDEQHRLLAREFIRLLVRMTRA
jgi:transcriptional regulator with XRE-family HTH domain